MDRCRKSRPPLGFDPWTIQAVASHYTDYATQPTVLAHEVFKFETCSVVSGMLFVFIDIAIISIGLQVISQQVYWICTMYNMLNEDTELLMI
jgi:hypothetical protein